jgi:hypothetical protein
MSASFRTNTNEGEAIPMELHTVELGNSDRIRLKFGSYGIEVLESGERIRVSNLYSIENGITTVRTFAVVAYPLVIEPEFRKEHDEIINGQSIGIVFKNNGWVIDKRHQYFGKINLPPEKPGGALLFGDIGITRPVVHVYSLFVKKDAAEFRYASIAEVHHPGYINLVDLKTIYGDQYNSRQVMDERVLNFLEIVKTKMQAA